ncbi:uncharacterized protein LOC128736326 [Sabethes cyaneus]|uniref:uncharacterized protein LOC128736326 n=1 Tax=Sabethes cyaneus TaxID=53552 RepID=UPI00237D3D79|nr:uncharacterized protein LOC128736326 [Sabethes cyaneus]
MNYLLIGQFLLYVCKTFAHPDGYSIDKPTQPFAGYDYPKPSILFEHSCPVIPPSTQYITLSVTETKLVQATLPPVTSIQLQTTTNFVTLPRLTEFFTETKIQTLTATATNYLTVTSTAFQIQPTTLTSYLTTTIYAPKTYLPPAAPVSQNTYLPTVTARPTSANTYLPNLRENIEHTTPNTFLQSYGFSQAAPIKRMTEDITANTLDDQPNGNTTQAQLTSPPAINIIYFDRRSDVDEPRGPPADLMSWLLCRFNLLNRTCEN